jgi:tetratricopeptide (TPR) repeat protein
LGSILGFSGVRVELWAGDLDKAIEHGERGTRILIESGQTGVASTSAGILARAYFARGDFDQAASWVTRAEELSAPDDVLTRLFILQMTGLLAAQRGDVDEAERSFDDGVSLAKTTHSPVILADMVLDRGLAHQMLGRRAEAIDDYREALTMFEAKEWVTAAKLARARLAEIGG